MPASAGMWSKNSCNASSPPADAPTPTTGNLSEPGSIHLPLAVAGSFAAADLTAFFFFRVSFAARLVPDVVPAGCHFLFVLFLAMAIIIAYSRDIEEPAGEGARTR